MSLQESRGKIAGSLRDLFLLWANTKVSWNDPVSQQFEETFLLPMEGDLRQAASAMDQMASILAKVKHDCE